MTYNLDIVDCQKATSEQRLKALLGSGRNFITVDLDPSTLKNRLQRCDIPADYVPETLQKWGIYALNDSLSKGDVLFLLAALSHGMTVSLVEAIRLPLNFPPKFQEYVVYCEVRGIISDHPNESEAHRSLQQRFGEYTRARSFPGTGIYRWSDEGWKQMKKSF